MSKHTERVSSDINLAAAEALLRTTIDFLTREGVCRAQVDNILERARNFTPKRRIRREQYRLMVRAYEEMGIVLSTWFTDPRFLDGAGHPLPLRLNRGSNSFNSLVKASGVRLSTSKALSLLMESPSVRVDGSSHVVALQRAFILRNFEIPRATLIIERFLSTLRENRSAQRNELPLLLERCCYVTGIRARNIALLMRDIKARGAAFIDSVDGEIEASRVRHSEGSAAGEMGVVAFAWTQKIRPPRRRRNVSSVK